MSKVSIRINGREIFSSSSDASIMLDSGAIEVQDESFYPIPSQILFLYVFLPGQYAKVQMLDGVETVFISFLPAPSAQS